MIQESNSLNEFEKKSATEITMYKKQINEKNEKIKSLQSANKNGDDEKRKVVDECLQLKVTVSSLKESLENSKQNIVQITSSNESLKNEIDEILSSKKQEIFAQEKLFQQNIENLEATYKAKIIEIENKLEKEVLDREVVRKDGNIKNEKLEAKLINKTLEMDSIISKYESEKAILIQKHNDRLLEQENQYSKAMKDMSERLNNNMATAEIAFNAKIDNLEKTFEEEKESNTKDSQEILQKFQKNALIEKEALVKKYERENNTALEKQREKSEHQFNQEKQLMQEKYNSQLLKQKKEYETAMDIAKREINSSTEDIVADLKKQQKVALNVLKEDHSAKIEDLNQCIMDASKKQVKQIDTITKSHSMTIQNIKFEHSNEIKKLSKKYEDEKQNDLQRLTKSLENDFLISKGKEMEMLKAVLTKQFEKTLELTKRDHNEKVHTLSTNAISLNTTINSMKEELSKLEKEFKLSTQKYESIVKETNMNIMNLKIEHQNEIDSLSAQHVAHLKEEKELWISESQNMTLETVEKEKRALEMQIIRLHEDKIRDRQQEHNNEISKLMKKMADAERENYEKNNKKMSDLREKFDSDREKLLSKHEKSIMQYNEKSTSTLLQSQQQWQDDIVKYNKMLREKEELVKEAYEVKKVEIEQIRDEFAKIKTNLVDQHETIVLNLTAENANKLESLSLELKEKHLSEIENIKSETATTLKDKYEAKVADSKNCWEVEKESMANSSTENVRNIEAKRATEYHELENKLKQVEETYSKQISQLQEEKESLALKSSNEISKMRKFYDEKMQVSMDNLAVSAKQDHETHISNLVKEFEAKEKETKEMYENNISRQLAKVKEAFEIEKNNTMEKLQQKQSIEIENAVQVHIDKFDNFTTNLEVLQSEYKNNHVERMISKRKFAMKKMRFKHWILFKKTKVIQKLTDENMKYTNESRLAKAQSQIKSGIYVLSNWSEKSNLGKKFNAFSYVSIYFVCSLACLRYQP